MLSAHFNTWSRPRVPGVPTSALREPVSRAEVSLRLGPRWDLLGGMALPGEALRMARPPGPAAGTPRRLGRCPRDASARYSGAGPMGSPSPVGQGHELRLSWGRGSEGGLSIGWDCLGLEEGWWGVGAAPSYGSPRGPAEGRRPRLTLDLASVIHLTLGGLPGQAG